MVAIESKDDLYVIDLLEDFDEFYLELEKYAEGHRVPIIDKIGIRFLIQMLKVKNIEKRNLTDKTTLLHADALELKNEVVTNAPYDVVFIDGAKSQSRKFFELYEPYFAEDVVVITDNVLFKGMVADPSIIKHSRDLKQLSRKINNYNEWLLKHENYESVILPFGDGITITTRK